MPQKANHVVVAIREPQPRATHTHTRHSTAASFTPHPAGRRPSWLPPRTSRALTARFRQPRAPSIPPFPLPDRTTRQSVSPRRALHNGMLHELAPSACGGAAGSAFSLLFPVAGGQFGYGCEDGGCGQQVVDCTLSLGTPSTRRAQQAGVVHGRRTGPGVSWQQAGGGGSPARRCANCDTASTPLWRNGPRGPKVCISICSTVHAFCVETTPHVTSISMHARSAVAV
jgi:hypothetical protein